MSKHPEINQLIDHLFRNESGKMVSVLTRIFGSGNLCLAEDVVQDALIEAVKHWTYQGVPENPSAWLYKVAKNKALNIINRGKYKRRCASDVVHFLQSPWTIEPVAEYLFTEQEIHDDQLRMMFTCCHPSVSPDSQVALILKTLCGFSIAEIAKAFLTTHDNVNKRLVRARKKIRDSKVPFEVPYGEQLELRMQVVLEAIYLLFNEGYSASKGESLVRLELCEEAIYLAEIIVTHPNIKDKSNATALLALMQLNASRFMARQDKEGNILTLEQQDRTMWNYNLMKKGLTNLEKSIFNREMSIYHILASISAYHCIAGDFKSTDWKSILALYDMLVQIDHSPVVLLNRAIALSKANSAEQALVELEKIKGNQAMQSYHLFYSTQAELYIQTSQFIKASKALRFAIEQTSQPAEKKLLKKRLQSCEEKLMSL